MAIDEGNVLFAFFVNFLKTISSDTTAQYTSVDLVWYRHSIELVGPITYKVITKITWKYDMEKMYFTF